MCYIDDDGLIADIYRDTRQRARKVYRCCECNTSIAPGDEYIRNVTLFEGRFSTAMICAVCQSVREEYGRAHRMIPGAGGLIEELDNCILEEPTPETIAMRARVPGYVNLVDEEG